MFRSLPFVAEKLGELLLVFLNMVNDEEAEAQELEQQLHQADLERRRLALRNKVQSVSRMLSMYKQLREEREAVMKLGAISPDGVEIPISAAPEPEPVRPKVGELPRSRVGFFRPEILIFFSPNLPLPSKCLLMQLSKKSNNSIEPMKRDLKEKSQLLKSARSLLSVQPLR